MFFLAPKIFFIESGEIQRGRGASRKKGEFAGLRLLGDAELGSMLGKGR